MTKPHQQTATAAQLAIIKSRIENCVCRRNLPVAAQLGTILGKSDFQLVRTAIWDEYQVHIDTIDTIKDIAYILQQKINQ